MPNTKRIKPQLGDALLIGYTQRIIFNDHTTAAMAECECGSAVYTAISWSPETARKIIERKHVKHLKTCARQAELFSLDEKRSQ